MPTPFYERAGSLISPGDLLGPVVFTRAPKPLKVARKIPRSLPKSFKIQGELREILEVGKHEAHPEFDFDPAGEGEEILSRARMSRAVFLTWGSEVEDDERGGNLHRKDWLIAPIFPLPKPELEIRDARAGRMIQLAEVIRNGQSPRYFPLLPLPEEESRGFYVDFRKTSPVAATYFQSLPRQWRLAPVALNDFYHHLMWFFTRRRIFFSPVPCPNCRTSVDLGIVFQGQPIDAEAEVGE